MLLTLVPGRGPTAFKILTTHLFVRPYVFPCKALTTSREDTDYTSLEEVACLLRVPSRLLDQSEA
jgi:hypothetical protein